MGKVYWTVSFQHAAKGARPVQFYLLTVGEAQQYGGTWKIAPLVSVKSLMERGPKLMVPIAGEELELHVPDVQTMSARIATFGIDAWRDSEGNVYTNSDPSDPSMTLTIICDAAVREIPPRTKIWLSNARFAGAPAAS
jgi:hypothetical protein